MRSPRVIAVAAVILLAASIIVGTHHVRPRPHPTPHPTSRPSPAASPSGYAVSCGVERWNVKTGTDILAGTVPTAPQVTTIAALAALPGPKFAPYPASLPNHRIGPAELHTYQVTATVTAYKQETDSDVHLALADTSGHTMIAEIPDPACVAPSSPFRTAIAAVRAYWDSTHPLTPFYANVGQVFTLTGVGFYDRIHGQLGVAPNGIELHPLLAISSGAHP